MPTPPLLPGPRILSLDELADLQPPAIEYVIADGILYKGTGGFLYGQSKSWKSIETIHTAFAVASGTTWYGHKVNQCAVLIHQTEIPIYLFRKRVMKFMAGYKKMPTDLHFMSQHYLKLDGGYGLGELVKAMEQVRKKSNNKHILLIIDPLYNAISGNINESRDVQSLLDNINQIRAKFDCTVLIVHHMSKKQFTSDGEQIGRGADSIHGSSWLRNWCDVAISMELDNPPPGHANKVNYQFELTRNAETCLRGFQVRWNRTDLQPAIVRVFETEADEEQDDNLNTRKFDA